MPDLDDALIDRIVEQSDAQAAGRSVSELEEERDANLVAMLKALRQEDTAAGAFLNRLGRPLTNWRSIKSRARIELAKTDFSNEQICAHRGASGAYREYSCGL